jgi:CDP-4-dehydro-6-deoxyglucose reductase
VTYRVYVAHIDQCFEVGADETVLAAALRDNISLAHVCQLGGCGTCRVKLIEGSVSYPEFPLALTPEEAAEGYALACQAIPTSDLVICPARVDLEALPSMRLNAVVQSVEPFSPLVTHLTLEIPEATSLTYRPGQYMNLIMPDGSTRSFSMASKPRDNRLDFHIRRIEGGSFTEKHLPGIQPGDRLDVEIPLGSFCFQAQDYRPLLMVATGTGLAPIKAILESLMDATDCPPVRLYWGTRTAADLYLHSEIPTWAERFGDFVYVPVLSRAEARWTGSRGYVQTAVTADIKDLSEYAIYLCGSPEMISSAKQAFLLHRASVEHIYSEAFVARSA